MQPEYENPKKGKTRFLPKKLKAPASKKTAQSTSARSTGLTKANLSKAIDDMTEVMAKWGDIYQETNCFDRSFEFNYSPSKYQAVSIEIAKLVETKQIAYGDAFGKSGQIMAILYPKGIPLNQMDDALSVVRIIDKLFRIATAKDALGESPWRDITGYGLLSVVRDAHRIDSKAKNSHSKAQTTKRKG